MSLLGYHQATEQYTSTIQVQPTRCQLIIRNYKIVAAYMLMLSSGT